MYEVRRRNNKIDDFNGGTFFGFVRVKFVEFNLVIMEFKPPPILCSRTSVMEGKWGVVA